MPSKRATSLSQESIDRFRNWLSGRGRSELTAKAYTSDLKMFLLDLHKKKVKEESFEDAALTWLQTNRNIVSPKTTGRRLTSLKSFAKWAGWEDTLSDYSAPTPAKGQPHPLPEGIAGVHALLAAAHNDKQRCLIALCGLCGLRIAEALSLKASNFNMEEMTFTVRGKGDKERVVPFSQETWNILATSVVRSMTSGDCEIVGLQDRYARRTITELGKQAGLKRHISSHDLRATFATAVFDKTLDQRVVQMLLGHSSGATTEIYIGRTNDQIREAVQGL